MVREVLCSEGASGVQRLRSTDGEFPLAPTRLPPSQSPSRVCFLWSSSLASGLRGHMCVCDTQEWLPGSSTLMGNRFCMGR